MDALEFYIGELEEALDPVESQLRLSGQVEVPRLRRLVEAAHKVIDTFDDEPDPEPEDAEILPLSLHDDNDTDTKENK